MLSSLHFSELSLESIKRGPLRNLINHRLDLIHVSFRDGIINDKVINHIYQRPRA